MKNNTLKKISAIALAAVMAVTFAPVASLQAFAAVGASTDPVQVSGTGLSNVDGGYGTLKDAIDELYKAKVTDATITLQSNYTASTENATTVTGSALALAATPRATSGKLLVFGGGQSDRPVNITLDLGNSSADLATGGINLGVSHDVNLKIVDTGDQTNGVKLGTIYTGALENETAAKTEGWDKATLEIDAGSNSIKAIDSYFTDVTLKSGTVLEDITFGYGQEATINKGADSVHDSIGISKFVMDGGEVDGYIKNAQGDACDNDGKLKEGLGEVHINQGTFLEDPLGDTVANSYFNYAKYSNKNGTATFGFVKSGNKADTQDASMIGDTPVARIAIGTDNKYYAGQETIDKKVKSISWSADNATKYFNNDGTATIDAGYTDGTVTGDSTFDPTKANIIIVANPVKINAAPWGSVVYCLNRIAGKTTSPTAVEVTPASGLSKLTETTKKTRTNNYVDTWTKVLVGDKTIIKDLDNTSVEDLNADKAKLGGSAVFKNGGNTLEVVADEKTYLDPDYLNTKIVPSAKAITVVELSTNNSSKTGYKYALLGGLDETYGTGDPDATTTDKINDNAARWPYYSTIAETTMPSNGVKSSATVSADKKYTVVDTTASNGKRYVAVTESRIVFDKDTQALGNTLGAAVIGVPTISGTTKQVLVAPDEFDAVKANVQQVGASELSETGANGILFINGLSGKDTVTSTVKTEPIAYNGTVTLVGDRSAQVATVSSTGRNIINQYAVAGKNDFIPAMFAIGGTQTYVQGNTYLPEVPRKVSITENSGDVVDKDAVKTWVEFLDGASVGITKTPNVTTNGYGVKMVSSVNVTVGSGDASPRAVYRFRNTKNGEHLYTVENSEINSLLKSDDWVVENTNAFTVLPYNTTVAGAVPVRRYHNIKTNEFLYSTDVNGEQVALDADPNWVREGIAFCGLPTGEGYAVTRVTNTIFGGHVYSTSVKGEVTPLVESGRGYKVDGVVFNAVETPEKEK